MEPSSAPKIHQIIIQWQYRTIPQQRIFTANTFAVQKLNNTEAKLTGVPPHFYVIVRVKTAMLS